MYNNDLELIRKYVEGLDIEEDLDSLESDVSFMTDVVNYTNDKNIYNMCSDEVKGNYDFIVFLMNKFKNDADYICKIIDKYITLEEDHIKKLDSVVKAYNLIKKRHEKADIYSHALDMFYAEKRIGFEAVKSENEDKEIEEFINEAGKGFILFQDTYMYSEDLLNYFALKCVNEIFIYHNLDIEVLLHERFNSFSEAKEYGINNFLLDVIRNYDIYLADYIANHFNIVDDLKKKIERAEKNWNHFEISLESRKYRLIWDVCSYYLIDNLKYNCTVEDFIYFVGKELGIEKKLEKYDFIKEIEDYFSYGYSTSEDEKNNYDESEYLGEYESEINKEKFDFCDLAAYNKVKTIMIEILQSKKPESLELIKENDGYVEKKAKILKLNQQKNIKF